MFKKVDVFPQGPIFSLRVPVTSPMINVEMSVGDILRCIHSRALVVELLPDGQRLPLDLSNYDKDNASFIKKEITNPVKVEKVIEPLADAKVEENPVIEEVKKEEVPAPKQDTEKEEVKTMNRDPKYFKQVEQQKNNIKKK